MSAQPRAPFSILTGFLGAGKTTVLNRLLSNPMGRRIAVLVNELGRIDIDSRLILSRGGDVLELAGGCVCCKVDVKNDLWDGIADVIRRSQPDHVVLETTGIAQPEAIIEGFARLPESDRDIVDLAGIICVIDAEAGVAQLDRHEEARAQLKAADRVLLSKLDIAGADVAEPLHRHLRARQPDAEVASFPRDDAGTRALSLWLLERRQRTLAEFSAPVSKHRHGQISAIAFADSAPMLAEPLLSLLGRLGDRLLRAKGFVHLAGETRRGFVEHAGLHTSLRLGEPWGAEPARTELVIIGEDLDDLALHRQLWACQVARAQPPPAGDPIGMTVEISATTGDSSA